MTDESDVDLRAWLAHVRELTKSAGPQDERAEERAKALFDKLAGPITPTIEDQSDVDLRARPAHVRELTKSAGQQDELYEERARALFDKLAGTITPTTEAQSRILDSSEMEVLHAVDRLARKPDGTTVVRYYFSNVAAEVNGVCSSDALFHPECAPLGDDRTKALAREAMKAIVDESRAKIEFQEASTLTSADIAFVRSSGALQSGETRADGYSGRAGDINYVFDGMGASNFKGRMEEEFNQLPPEQREKFRDRIMQEYGGKYGKDADLFTILTSEREKMVIAHEIEHTLGAGHPDATVAPQLSKQTIMGHIVLANSHTSEAGKVLGNLDVEWYQRHFGVKDLQDGTLPDPLPVRSGTPGETRKR